MIFTGAIFNIRARIVIIYEYYMLNINIFKIMHEILTIEIGECGNRVGMKFWETISYEHKINERGKYRGNNPDQHLENIQTFYNIQEDLQSETYTYIPRSIHIDLDPERI